MEGGSSRPCAQVQVQLWLLRLLGEAPSPLFAVEAGIVAGECVVQLWTPSEPGISSVDLASQPSPLCC